MVVDPLIMVYYKCKQPIYVTEARQNIRNTFNKVEQNRKYNIQEFRICFKMQFTIMFVTDESDNYFLD